MLVAMGLACWGVLFMAGGQLSGSSLLDYSAMVASLLGLAFMALHFFARAIVTPLRVTMRAVLITDLRAMQGRNQGIAGGLFIR